MKVINLSTYSFQNQNWARISDLIEACHINGAKWVSVPTITHILTSELNLTKIDILTTSQKYFHDTSIKTLDQMPFHKTLISYYLAMRILNEVSEIIRKKVVPDYAYV